MIAIIRIAGQCKQKKKTIETFKRLKLEKKYSCALVDAKDKVRMGMIESVKDSCVYGEIPIDLEKQLIEKRGKEGKTVYFLHPPRGGFKKSTKLSFPKGILGKNKDISKLLERML